MFQNLHRSFGTFWKNLRRRTTSRSRQSCPWGQPAAALESRIVLSSGVGVGDLAVVSYNADSDMVALVALADIPDGETVFLTDRGWNGTTLHTQGTFETNITWITQGVTQGSIIRLSMSSAATFVDRSYGTLIGTINLDVTSGDQLLIYQTLNNNTESSPSFISAFNGDNPNSLNLSYDDGPWDGWSDSDTLASNSTSKLPSGLTAVTTSGDTGTALGAATNVPGGLIETDNFIYNGPTSSASRATWINRINTFTNWQSNDLSGFNLLTDGALGVFAFSFSVAPTASIVVSDDFLTANQTSSVVFTFNQAVTGFTNADLSITNGTLSPVSSLDGGTTWTAILTPYSNLDDTTNVITLNLTGVTGSSPGVGLVNSNNFSIATRRPTAMVTLTDANLTIGETSQVTITFSEPVSGFTVADLTVANGTLSSVTAVDGGLTWTTILTPNNNITDHLNTITVNLTGVTDSSGNTGLGTTDSGNYIIDTVRPTASILIANPTLLAGETSQVTITFSEPVSGLTVADLSVANGTLSSVTSVDSGLTWTTILTPNDQVYALDESLTVDSNQIMDFYGNLWIGPLTSSSYSIDTINNAPTIELTNTTDTLDENSSTATRIKVADVSISDDGRGINTLSLSGADIASFELDGTELFLKADVLLNYEIQSSYTITIQTDDATISGVPDATVAFQLDLNDLNEAPVHTGPTTFSFEEFSARWTVVGRLTASDPDGSPLTYSIVSGNPDDTLVIGDGSNPALAGTLWVNRQDLTGLRHRGSFSLRVRVTDNGPIPLSTEFDVKIYITPVTSKSLQIMPAVDGHITRNGTDNLLNTSSTQLRIEGGTDWTRAVLEFDLSAIPANKVLKDAWLFFETTSIEGTASPDFLPIEIYGYGGDGEVDISDASRGSLIGWRPLHHLSSTNQLKVHSASLDPAYVRTLVGTGTLGLVLRNEETTYATTLNSSESSALASAKPYLVLQLADPQPDLIIHDPGTSGTGHEILILDSEDSSFTATIDANLFEATPWERFFTGDFNADGHTDIAGLQADGSWWVSLTNAEGTLQTATLWNTGEPGVNWSNILVADFDGNGRADIATRSNDGNWTVLVSTGDQFTDSVWGQWATSSPWSNVLSADFNRDGRGDLAGRNELGEWYVSLSMGDGTMTTSKWGQWSTTTTWSDVQVGDFNGDGRADIIGRSTIGQWWVNRSTGSTFSAALYYGLWSTRTTWSDVRVADFNGDGRDDIIGRSAIGQWWVSLVATSNFSTSLASSWTGPQSKWSEVTVGDFNSDGKADLAARNNLTNEVWTSLGSQGSFTTSVWATLPNLGMSLWRILNSGSLF